MRSEPIDFRADRIDSREIASRIDYLTCDHLDDKGEVLPESGWEDSDEYTEYVGLRDLMRELSDSLPNGYDPADDCIMLIKSSEWRDYIIEETQDMWDSNWFQRDPRTLKESPLTWDDITSREPFNCIDWDMYARGRRTHHSEVTIDGTDYVIAD